MSWLSCPAEDAAIRDDLPIFWFGCLDGNSRMAHPDGRSRRLGL